VNVDPTPKRSALEQEFWKETGKTSRIPDRPNCFMFTKLYVAWLEEKLLDLRRILDEREAEGRAILD
jgi:hypothetical protein